MAPSSSPEKNRRKKQATGGHPSPSALFQSSLFGSLCGLFSAALLLLAATLLCTRVPDPAPLMTPLALGALYLSSAVAGFAALKRHRASALLCGSLAGLWLLLFFLALALVLGNVLSPSFPLPLSILLRALMLPAAAVGGFLGLSRPKRRPRTAKRR